MTLYNKGFTKPSNGKPFATRALFMRVMNPAITTERDSTSTVQWKNSKAGGDRCRVKEGERRVYITLGQEGGGGGQGLPGVEAEVPELLYVAPPMLY